MAASIAPARPPASRVRQPVRLSEEELFADMLKGVWFSMMERSDGVSCYARSMSCAMLNQSVLVV